jgi:hypothetical protein
LSGLAQGGAGGPAGSSGAAGHGGAAGVGGQGGSGTPVGSVGLPGSAGPNGQDGHSGTIGQNGPLGQAAGNTTFAAGSGTGTVSGTVFLDNNATGVLDSSDPGLAGRVVYLDINNNGKLDSGEPSAVTDSAGHYTLTGVPAGAYTLRVATIPGDVTTGPDGGLHVIVVGGGTTLTGADLGLQPGSSIMPVSPSATPFGVDNPDTNTAAVQGLYHLVLGRAGSASEVAGWVVLLDHGTSFTSVAEVFLHSTEYESHVVLADYQNFLGRTASPAEVNGMVSLLQRGWTEAQVAQVFLTSTEYSDDHASNDDFVHSLYHNVLGRQPAAAEVAGWVQFLNAGGSRQTVIADFVNSAEADQRVIESDYLAYLARQGGAAEVNGWVGQVQQGRLSLTDVAATILGSTEFQDRASQTVG